MISIKFAIHWYIICLYLQTFMFHLIVPSEQSSLLSIFVNYGVPGQNIVWVYPNFWSSWSGGNVYQISCFYHNLHYFCAMSPNYYKQWAFFFGGIYIYGKVNFSERYFWVGRDYIYRWLFSFYSFWESEVSG